MDRFYILIRSIKRYSRLRKAESAHLPQRQNSHPDHTPPAGKTVLFILPNVVLHKKKLPDPVDRNAPDLADLHTIHLESINIINEKSGSCKKKNAYRRAVSYQFVQFGTRSLAGRLKKQRYNDKIIMSKFRFCKSGGRASFRKRRRHGFSMRCCSGRGIIFYGGKL